MFKYILRSSAEPKVIGVRDGGSQIRLSDPNQNDPNLKKFLWPKNGWPDLKIDNLSKYESELNFNLKKQAKITDCLCHSPYIHIVGVYSERFVELLKNFKLNEHIIFKEVNIHKDGMKIQEKYFLIQQTIFNDTIDWENSLFYNSLQRSIGKNEFCFKFNDLDHYKDNVCIDISKISFKNKEIENYDFVSALSEDFISDRLAKAITESNFTNIVLKNIETISCSDVVLYDKTIFN